MRFWSPEQKYLLEVLKKTGCMRKSQALTLLHRQFGTSPNAIGPICRQLRDAGYLREFDGVISAVGPQYEPFIPNAIDLILAIFPRELPIFERTARNSLYALGTQSGLLARVFFLSREQKMFALPERDIVAEPASTLTVLLLEDATQAGRIPSDLSCLLAYPEQNGKLTLKQHNGGKNYEN